MNKITKIALILSTFVIFYRMVRSKYDIVLAFLKRRKCSQCQEKLGTLCCIGDYWICETCAQINSERGHEIDR